MRLPNRKPGKYTFAKFDPVMTQEKFDELQNKLTRIKKVSHPQAVKDTQKYAENGDFSENAEYQIAKGRLRRLNQTITELEHQIAHAEIIKTPRNTTTVQVGHTVTIATNDKTMAFQILGSTETNPTAGIISYKSPLGAALLGHSVGDIVTIKTSQGEVNYKIITITCTDTPTANER